MESCCHFASEAMFTSFVLYWVAWRNTLTQPCWGLLGYLILPLWVHLLHTFRSLLRVVFRYFTFPQSSRARLSAGSPTFDSPRAMPWNAHVRVLPSNAVVRPALCPAHQLSKERQLASGCHMSGACRALVAPWGTAGKAGEASQQRMSSLLAESVAWSVRSVSFSFLSSVHSAFSPSPPLSLTDPFSVLGEARKVGLLWQCPVQFWKLDTHLLHDSHLPPWEKMWD